MSTVAGELVIEIEGREVGLSSLLQKVDQQTQKAADSALKLQQQYARLAQSQGNTAGASKILSNALVSNGGASEQAVVGVATQLTKLESGLQNSGMYAQQFGQAMSSSLLGIVGPAAAATAAIGALKGGFDLTIAGSQLIGTERSFQSLAASAGQSSQALLSAMRSAAAGTIADAQLMQSANTGLLLSNGRIAKDLPRLIEVARASAQATGQDIGFIFDSLVRGISRGSPQIIDNAGITLDAAAAFETYAKSIGKAPDQLSKAEQQQATLNAVLAAGNDIIAKSGVAADAQVAAYTRLGTAITNIKNTVGERSAVAFAPFTEGLSNVLTGLDGTAQGFANFAAGVATAGQSLGNFGPVSQAQADSNQQFADSMLRGAQAVGEFLGIVSPATSAVASSASAYDAATASMRGQADAQAQVSAATAANVAAQQQAIAAIQQSAQASVADAATKDAQAATTQLLQLQTQQAAQAFLALNPGISGSGIASAQASGQISAAVAQYINMTLAAQAARNQLAALQAQAGVAAAVKVGGQGAQFLPIGRTDLASAAEGQANVARLQTLNRQEKDLADARRQQTIATGSAAQVAALYNKELADATRIYGANSAQAIRARTTLDQYTASQRKAGGGGGAKLTDQQKVNNSLLADQERYQQQSADAAAQYTADVEKIYRTYYERMKDAQEQFDQDSLEGRASFYDNLGSIESDKIRQSASAQYEAAAQEAGQIAAQKGADVADKYMQAQEQIISARAKRLAEIEKASKEGDDGRAEYLKGVDAQYRAAEEAKLARIQEGNGSLASERDKQLAEADAKEQESQDKLATAAERAADRKILAADRAGKKIDEEQAKASALAATYDKIAAAGAPTTGGAPVGPGASPTAAPASAGAPASIADLIAKLGEVKDALVAATNGGADRIVRSIDKVGQRGGVAG